MENKQFLCMKEAAELLSVNVQTMRKILNNADEQLFTRLGRKLIINKDRLINYMNTHSVIHFK